MYLPGNSPLNADPELRSYLERELQAIARQVNAREQFDLDDFGTDAGAIQAAVDAAAAAGGGTIRFRPGFTYDLSDDGGTHNVVVSLQGANHNDATVALAYNVLLDNVEGITFDLQGATIVSGHTAGNTAVFLLDGARRIAFHNGKIQGQHTHDSSGDLLVPGAQAICCTSQDRDSYGIRLENLDLRALFSGLYCFGTKDATFRVRGVTVDQVRLETALYGLVLHENGDNVTAKAQVLDTSRDFFIFGANQFDLDVFGDPGAAGNTIGYQALIKAYRNDTHSGRVRYRTTKLLTAPTSSHVVLASDYDTDTQATPARIRNIEFDIDNSEGSDKAGVAFSVLEDAAFVTAATQVFDGITLRGIHRQIPDFSTSPVQNVDGSLDTDNVIAETGDIDDVYTGTGFVNPSI